MSLFKLCVANLVTLFWVVVPAVMGANIIPQPSYVQEKQGTFDLAHNNNILYAGKHPEVNQIIDNFMEQVLGDYGLRLQANKSKKAGILLQDKKSLNEEAYELSVVANKVVIKASAPAGFFYALRTVNQLILADKNHTLLPCILVKDAPRFSYRGFLIDAGRYYLPLKDVKKAIDLAANYKLNRFHWHLTDDQGWRLEIKKYPRLTEKGSVRSNSAIGTWDQYYPRHYDGKEHSGYYTQDEIRDIVRYAADRQITIVPEIEMPGHALAALSVYPEYACSFHSSLDLMAGAGISDQVYCPKPQTFRFIKDILTEIASLFPGEYIHIGGDECPKVRWEKCPKCQERIKSLGLKSDAKHTKEQRLQSYMIQEAAKYLKEKGKRIIGWTEILEGGLVPDATLMSWIGESGGIEAAHQHHDVIMTPNTYLYFDYYQSKKVEDEPLAIGGYLPIEKTYNYEPMPKELTEEEQQYIKGVQANLWTEYIPIFSQVQYMVLPRLGAAAEVQWTDPSKKDYKDFLRRVPHLVAVYDCYGWNYATHVYDVNVDMKADTVNHVLNVQLSTMADDPIYYTLDGQDPTEKSLKYTKPFTIDQSVVLKTMAVHPDRTSKISVDTIRFNKATLKPVVLLQPNESRFSPDGPVVLVDGRNGNHSFDTGAWLAVAGNDLEAVINMQAETILSSASVHVYVRKDAWLFDARGFSVSVSSDNKNYKEVASQEYKQMQESDSDGIIEHELSFDPCKATYVKIKVISEKSMPDWHWDAGKAPFLLVDEIILN